MNSKTLSSQIQKNSWVLQELSIDSDLLVNDRENFLAISSWGMVYASAKFEVNFKFRGKSYIGKIESEVQIDRNEEISVDNIEKISLVCPTGNKDFEIDEYLDARNLNIDIKYKATQFKTEMQLVKKIIAAADSYHGYVASCL